MLNSQLGIAEESAFGTYEVPTRFYEFVSEGLQVERQRIESEGIRAGSRLLRQDRWVDGQVSVSGPIVMELATKSMGLWFKHAFGDVATSQPDGSGAPSVYQHEFTMGALRGKSLTIQVGRDQRDGTVQPFSYVGCKVASWELACAVGEIARFTATIMGADEDTGQSLAPASYPSGLSLLSFVEGSLKIAGADVPVREANITGDNGLNEDDYAFNSRIRRDPIEPALREVTGSLDADFDGLTAYNRFINGTHATLELLFQGGIIEAAFAYEVKLTANVRFDGQTPTVGGREDEIRQPLDFKVVDPGDGSDPIALTYQTDDTTP